MEGKILGRETRAAHNPKMVEDLFKKLPSEIILNIHSRLPAKSTFSCKCVCKPWLDMITTDEFVKSHLSKAVPGLVVCQKLNPMKICVFDDLGSEQTTYPCNASFYFTTPVYEVISSSVNGLIFFDKQTYPVSTAPFVCNPITRDSIRLPFPPGCWDFLISDSCGFGVSKATGQYKVVRIFNPECPLTFQPLFQSVCQVYTLGTGLWRGIGNSGPFRYGIRRKGAFLNGNLHWLVVDSNPKSSPLISCFDVETELFSTFATPNRPIHKTTLSVLKDCLCLCDNSAKHKFVIWIMKEYGDGNSWTKEFIISRRLSPVDLYRVVLPVKVFENGDVLIAKEGCSKLLCYSKNTNTIRIINLLELNDNDDYNHTKVIIYTPSLVSLKTFTMEMADSSKSSSGAGK